MYFYTRIAQIGGFVIILEIDISCNEKYWNLQLQIGILHIFELGNFAILN